MYSPTPGNANNAPTSSGTTPPCPSAITAAHSRNRNARRGYPNFPHSRSTASAGAAAKSAGPGHNPIHRSHTGATRATGVCWLITSDTSTPHADVPGRRHGKSRATAPNHGTSANNPSSPDKGEKPATSQTRFPRNNHFKTEWMVCHAHPNPSGPTSARATADS